jgi:L-lactate dehydrogenase complex protein LldG
MSSRQHILTKLQQATQRAGFVAQPDGFTEQADANPLTRYIELANADLTSTDRVQDWAAVPAAVKNYLDKSGLKTSLVLDSCVPLEDADWVNAGITVRPPPLNKDGDAFLSDCFGAVAENGSIVISSNDGLSMANNFLAETHIVLLRQSRIFPGLADLWRVLRAAGPMPREFCLVTGPSRTADLGVPAKMGAHGPARVHAIIVND